MKQNLEFSQELRCREAKNIIFCKILCIFPNSAQLTRFCEKFSGRRILEGLNIDWCYNCMNGRCLCFLGPVECQGLLFKNNKFGCTDSLKQNIHCNSLFKFYFLKSNFTVFYTLQFKHEFSPLVMVKSHQRVSTAENVCSDQPSHLVSTN